MLETTPLFTLTALAEITGRFLPLLRPKRGVSVLRLVPTAAAA
jgi:drug/metabolite transporter superfamily protein YnfA